MATNEGRFLLTDDVVDAQYLLKDPSLDVVVVEPTGGGVTFEAVADDPLVALYKLYPEIRELDTISRSSVEEQFPGLTVGDGFYYDEENGEVKGSSLKHVDLGRAWPFPGPLACSLAVSGTADWGIERTKRLIVRPGHDGIYRLSKTGVFCRLALETVRTLRSGTRTKVTQEAFNLVMFGNYPWVTQHSVEVTSGLDTRSARTYDQRLHNDPSIGKV